MKTALIICSTIFFTLLIFSCISVHFENSEYFDSVYGCTLIPVDYRGEKYDAIITREEKYRA